LTSPSTAPRGADDASWSRPPGRAIRFVLRASGLAAVGLGGWYLWWRLGTLAGTGRLGVAFLVAEFALLSVPAAAVSGPSSAPALPLLADTVTAPEAFVVPDATPIPAVRAPLAHRLLPPAAGAYFGVTAGAQDSVPTEAARRSPPGRAHIVQWFQQWRTGEVRLRTDWLNAVDRSGAIPMIVWEPWARPPGGYADPADPAASVAVIASGRYDAYIRSWAQALAEHRRPVLIKFMHEMNGTWYPWSVTLNGNTPAGYVQAWRHVHDLFREAGARNVSWVWSLNTEMGFDAGTAPPESYYPGPDYVDWVGISGMNWGTSHSWSRWTGVDTIFRADYRRLTALGHPIMITEIGTVARGGDPVAWISGTMTAFRASYPAIRAVVWFDLPYTTGVDFRLGARARTALARALADPYWRGEVRTAPLDTPAALPDRPPRPYLS